MAHRHVRALIALPLLAILSACGTAAQSAPRPAKSPQAQLQTIVASTDLAVGRNRFTFGVLNHNHPLQVPTASVRFFRLRGNVGTLVSVATAHFNYFSRDLNASDSNSAAVQIGGVYVSYPTFTSPGTWGAVVSVRADGRQRVTRATFTVQRHFQAPAVGSAAPRSNNPTTAQMPVKLLDSGRPPDDMHRLSIAHEIGQHHPLVVLFATAGFCVSRLCGPEIGVVQGLERQFGKRVGFIHIEVWKDANPSHGPAAAFVQWRLHTEPWVFVINRRGIITARFEGPTPATEIRPAIQKVA